MTRVKGHELRCFCSRQPLLGTYGVDAKGQLFVHVRIYKQNRIYGEVVATAGKVQLRCRDCFRWHTVTIRQPGKAVLVEETQPPLVAVAEA